jgi:hypothetical protein
MRTALGAAASIWSRVAGSSLTLRDEGGNTPDPGVIYAQFATDNIEFDQQCVYLAREGFGGPDIDVEEEKVIAGRAYNRAISGFANIETHAWPAGCTTVDVCLVTEILTHELGHAVGLGHAVADTPEAAAATMAPTAHDDCRCAGLGVADAAALAYVYPLERPVTITTPRDLPDAIIGAPYSVQLDAIGGSEPYTWERRDRVFQPPSALPMGLALDASGAISGSASEWGTHDVLIRTTDSVGDSHTKRFTVRARYDFETTTSTVTTTTNPQPAVEPGVIRCIPTTTTTTPPEPPCMSEPDQFATVECWLGVAKSTSLDMGQPGRRPLRILNAAHRLTTRIHHARQHGRIARNASAHLLARDALLIAYTHRPSFVAAVGMSAAHVLQDAALELGHAIDMFVVGT